MVRKHPQEWQPAPPLMSAEWTNPHTQPTWVGSRQQSWSLSLLSLSFLSLSHSFFSLLSPLFSFSSYFSRFFSCVCVFFFFIIILMPAKPTKELAITSVVANLLPAFQYTHRHTFAHSSTYTFAQSLPFFISQCKQTKKKTTQRIGFLITLPPGSGELEMFETHPQSASSLGKQAQSSLRVHFKFRGLGLSLWESLCDLVLTCGPH